MESNEEEYEYEETLVMVELQGIMENDFLHKVSHAKILGVDTEKPLLQLDDYTFCGDYQDTMGTCMLFQESKQENEAGKEEKKLEYSFLTNKKLCMQRVFLQKDAESQEVSADSTYFTTEEYDAPSTSEANTDGMDSQQKLSQENT